MAIAELSMRSTPGQIHDEVTLSKSFLVLHPEPPLHLHWLSAAG